MALRSCFCGSSPLAAARYQKPYSIPESGVWVCGRASFVTIPSRVTALKLQMEAEARDQHRPRKLPATHVHRNSSQDVFAAVGSACRRPAQLQRLDLKARSSKRFSKAIVFEARYGGFGAQKKRDSPEPPRGCPEPSRLEGHVTAVSLIKICFRIVAAG